MTLNFPTTRPTLTVDFQKSQKMHPLFNFERASTATQMNDAGVFNTVGNDVPRFAFNNGSCLGLLQEVESTNFNDQSNIVSGTWSITDGTFTSFPAPDGSNNATQLQGTNTGVQNNLLAERTITVPQPAPGSQGGQNDWCLSFYARRPQGSIAAFSYLEARFFDGSTPGNYKLFFDWTTRQWSTGVVTQAFADRLMPVQEVGGGWVRLGINVTLDVQTDPTGSIRIGISDGDGNVSTALMTPTNNIQIWGCQMENRNFYTSIIPTAGAQATRARENLICEGDDFQTFYGAGAGGNTIRYSGYAAPWRWIGSNSANNQNIYYNLGLGTNQFTYLSQNSTGISNVFIFSGSSSVIGGGGYQAGTYEPFVNAYTCDSGQRVATKFTNGTFNDQTTNVPVMRPQLYLAFGQYNAGDDRQKTVNIIARLDYWPIVVTDQELEALAPDS